MEDKRKTIDTRLEQKIGFDRVRRIISDRCSTEYAAGRTKEQKEKVLRMADFSSDPNVTYVPDPYYGGLKGFDNVIDILEDTCEGIYRRLCLHNK